MTLMTLLSKYTSRRVVNLSSRRQFSGHGLSKNIYVEENAGLREHTLHEFRFDIGNISGLFIGLFLPIFLIYEGIVWETVCPYLIEFCQS